MRLWSQRVQVATVTATAGRLRALYAILNRDRARALDSDEFAAARALEAATRHTVMLSGPGEFPRWRDDDLATREQRQEIAVLDAQAWAHCRLSDHARAQIAREIACLTRHFVVRGGRWLVLTPALALADRLGAKLDALEAIRVALAHVFWHDLEPVRATPPPLAARPAQQICAPNHR